MKKLSFLLLYIILLSTSCKKFLAEESKSRIDRARFYRTDQDAIAAVNAVYQAMRYDVTDMTPIFLQDWMSDDGTIGTSTQESRVNVEFLRYDSKHTDIRNTWSNAYRLIERANNVVAFATDSTVLSGETVRRVTAEARFLRAFYYFRLVQLFGGVPLTLEPADVIKNNLYPARATEAEVYQAIITDLQYAEAHLEDFYAYNDGLNGGRATRAAAIALLGKVYLTMAGFPLKDASKYQMAADKLKELIDDNTRYSVGLNPSYANLFHTSAANKAADRERIFYSKGSSGFPSNLLAYTWMKNKYSSNSMAKPSKDFNLYIFTAGTNAYTNMTGGTKVTAVQVDDAISGALPIGFMFNFGGLKFDKFYMSSNGFISFVNRTNSASNLNTFKDPLIGPLADNLNGTGGEATYATTGVAPNRVLTVQWKNWRWRAGTVVSNNISFQLKLYEGDGKFEMVYDQTAPAVNSVFTATVVNTGAFASSLRNAATAPAFKWEENTSYAHSIKEFEPGQIFTFTPNPRGFFEWADARRFLTVDGRFRVIKYNDPVTTALTDNADDYFWLRYSDVLLMYAEALTQIGGAENMDIALAQLNAIRKAHGGTIGTGSTPAISDLTYTSQEELIGLVRLERRRELAFENHRWYDLKRWGILPATIISHLADEYNRPESDFSYINENMNYLPIPYSDIATNPNLKQNKGY